MTSLQTLMQMGKEEMGLSGAELKQWVSEQQAMQREERATQRQ